MIMGGAGRWLGVVGAGWGALLLGAPHFVHKRGQAIHRRLERVELPVERDARGGWVS